MPFQRHCVVEAVRSGTLGLSPGKMFATRWLQFAIKCIVSISVPSNVLR